MAKTKRKAETVPQYPVTYWFERRGLFRSEKMRGGPGFFGEHGIWSVQTGIIESFANSQAVEIIVKIRDRLTFWRYLKK